MVAYAIEKATGDICEGPEVTIALAKAEKWYEQNPKWRNTPELMLRYRAASWFIRTTDPGVMMGFQTKEEAEDYTDYVEVPNEPAAPENIPQEANSETLNMEAAPEQPTAEPEKKEAEAPTQEPAKEAEAPKPEAAKPMGKQKTPDIFGNASK